MSINWPRVNKKGLRDASLHQKPVRLQGDVCVLTISNVLTLPGSQIKGFVAKKRKMEEPDLYALLDQLIVTLASQLLVSF